MNILLTNIIQGPNDVPRVSQYRLAAHLSSAVTLTVTSLRSMQRSSRRSASHSAAGSSSRLMSDMA